jgi:stage V sporulation protein SpoVS
MITLENTAAPYKAREGKITEAPAHELWIRAHDDVHRTAQDILDDLKDSEWIDLACIGAACVNQAMKSIAVAREMAMAMGKDLVAQPWFSSITDDQDRRRTRLMIRVILSKQPW